MYAYLDKERSYYKAEGISSTKQIVFFHLVRPCDNNCKNEKMNSYMSRAIKILIFGEEINDFEKYFRVKSKHVGIQRKEIYR